MRNVGKPRVTKVTAANKNKLPVQAENDLLLCQRGSNGTHKVLLQNVLHVPDITCNLVSVSAITKNGFNVTSLDNKCLVVNSGGAVVLEGVLSTNSVYKVHSQPCPAEVNKLSTSVAFKATVPQCIGLWHRRLAHLNVAYLRQLRDVATGIQLSDGQLQKCEVCVAGKLTNKPFLKNKKCASSLLDLVYSEVCQVSEPSLGQAKYFVIFLDDFSRKIFVYLIKTKDEV